MFKKESSFPNTTKEKYTNEKKQCEIEQKNDKNKYQLNNSNINQIIYDNKDIDNDNETEEEIDNLKYKENIQNSLNPFIQPLDSSDSPLPSYYKFSIDMPNVSKQRLHEYLSDDLLNAIESSPNIKNINSGIDNKKPEEDNKDTNLYGFSLYPSLNNNYIDSINNNNTINDSLSYNNKNNFSNKNNELYVNFKNNNNNIKENISNKINNSNINFQYNKINKSTNLNIGNTSINDTNKTFSKKTKKNKQLLSSNIETNVNNLKINDIRDNKSKTNINNNNILNNKNNKRMKKVFVYRNGDWTCNQCNNLNFGFRNKCNRCGIPKELSLRINMQSLLLIYNQNNNNNQMTINNGNSFIGKNNNNLNYYQYHL